MNILWPEPGAWAVILFFGIWVSLDQSACLQIMISQPVVASWIAGGIAGDPQSGLAVGMLLQGVWSRALPMGASPLPFVGPAAVVGGVLAAVAPGGRWELGPALAVPDALPLAVALGVSIAIGETGRPLLSAMYRHRGPLRAVAERGALEGRAGRIRIAHLAGMLPTALLGAVLVVVGLLTGGLLLGVLDVPPADGRWVALPVLGIGVGQAMSLTTFRFRTLERRS